MGLVLKRNESWDHALITGTDVRSNAGGNAANVSRPGWSTWNPNQCVSWCILTFIYLHLNEMSLKYETA